jgi:hypothetical protein
MAGVFLTFGGVVLLLFLIGPAYGWVKRVAARAEAAKTSARMKIKPPTGLTPEAPAEITRRRHHDEMVLLAAAQWRLRAARGCPDFTAIARRIREEAWPYEKIEQVLRDIWDQALSM